MNSRRTVFAYWLNWALSGLALGLLMGPAVAQSQNPMPIDKVKAAFIYKFASFVEWPEEAFENADDDFQIGVAASETFVEVLRDAVDGKSVADRSIRILPADDAQELESCQIVFLSETHERHEELLADLQSQTILTIGDSPEFAAEGGIIRLFEEGKRLRFEINLKAAKEANLRISSKLLDLASSVVGNANLETP